MNLCVKCKIGRSDLNYQKKMYSFNFFLIFLQWKNGFHMPIFASWAEIPRVIILDSLTNLGIGEREPRNFHTVL